MRDGHPWFAAAAAGGVLVLVLLGAIWAFGGYDGLGVVGGLALTLGIVVAVTLGVSLMMIILRGHRSRRDEAVHRKTGRGG